MRLAEEEKKKFPILMVIILVVVGLILAGGMSYFIATKVMTERAGGAVEVNEPGVFVKLGDPKDGIIVNVGGVKSGRFLKVGIVLNMNPANEENISGGKIVPEAETKILDAVLRVLRSEKVEAYAPEKQEELKTLIKDEVNKVIGENSVYEVYITNFVLQ